ncbi:hypothetical protein RchiOBHm_Chr5g0058361 [Rosa chinensis]|uniref:Uncharacterized protein n=1 Tax=Rosa chinensis TaxID=74649 RepID=A0A2P6QH49_ROSCH|nr:hypothetical protein RchiOBHm_Chr5g0058361 [Rosa chinensis]
MCDTDFTSAVWKFLALGLFVSSFGKLGLGSRSSSWPTSPQFDDFDWVSVDGSEDVEKAHGFLDDFVLGPVPSGDEVHNAILNASGLVQQVSSFGTESDWMEPYVYLCNSQPQGRQRVYEAFSLLQNESSVQRIVVSLSYDRAVWDAVMNNEVVRELRESFYAGWYEFQGP